LILTLSGCYRGTGGLEPHDAADLVARSGVTEPAVEVAAARLDAGEPDAAFETLAELFRSDPTRDFDGRDVALFLTAESLIARGERLKAFHYLEELLDTYPASDIFLAAVERQFEIADSYLDGEADSWGPFEQNLEPEAFEMLFRIQLRVPGTELAERALLRTADGYFDAGDHDFAEDAYTAFIERFPRSPKLPEAVLRQAWSNLLQYQGPMYDPTPLLDAREQFRSFSNRYPRLAETQDLSPVLTYINRQLAQKQRIKADFYDRTSRHAAAEQLRTEADVIAGNGGGS
jgi:outer membrane protein assembly factor BamD (BamD/ComL family)